MADTYWSLSLDQNRLAHNQVPDVYDIWFDAGLNLQVVTDAEAIAQRVRQHIELFFGEWFLNRSLGVEWFQRIFVEPFEREVAEALLKRTILDVPGVAAVYEFDMEVDFTKRYFKINNVAIQTVFDTVIAV